MLDQLADDVQKVLARNSAFYRDAPGDPKKHLAGPEVIAALTWSLLNVAVPVLVGAAGSIVADVVKNKLSKEKQSGLTKADLVELIQLWKEAELGKPDTEAAVTQVTAHLTHHGWPVQEAQKDAQRIVDAAVEQLLSDLETK